MRRLPLLVPLLALPIVATAAGLAPAADALGRHVGARLARLVPASAERGPKPVVLVPLATAASAAPVAEAEPSGTSVAVAPRSARHATARRAPARGIRVGAAKVLSLANQGARPSGVPVPAEGNRPAGLMLSGVSGLGVGLCDGDVLTLAAGQPARSPGQVISLVIASRGAKVPEISGRFWRNGEAYNLVVEQPYLAPQAADKAPPNDARPDSDDSAAPPGQATTAREASTDATRG